MKILKSLTTAAAILLIVGCAGNGSEDDTMPVPVHERETERTAVDATPAAVPPADAETRQTKEMPSGQQSGEAINTKSEAEEHKEKAATETVQKNEVETPEKKVEESVSEGISEETAKTVAETPVENATQAVAETTTETVGAPITYNAPEPVTETTPEVISESTSTIAPENISATETKEADLNTKKNRSCKGSWYAGVEGGLAFAESSFSSFGAGGSHAGGSGSMFAGYKFNSWLSLEIFAGLGGARMTARECCSEANLWLSSDGEQFRAAVLGKDGGYYSELESSVLWQNYGLRFNFDILALIPATKDGKWSLELSPAISALGPKAKIRTMAAKTPVFNAGNWQLGAGGRIQAGYAVLPWMRAGLFTGLTFGTGRHIDALPADDHRNNFIWESGVRLTFSIPDKNCKKSGR